MPLLNIHTDCQQLLGYDALNYVIVHTFVKSLLTEELI